MDLFGSESPGPSLETRRLHSVRERRSAMRFGTIRVAVMMAIGAMFALAGEQATLQGLESGHFITNAGAQPSTVITNDFAEGIAPRLGKYTLIAREEINLQT